MVVKKFLLPILIFILGVSILYYAYHQQTVHSERNFGVKIILTHPDGTTTEIYPNQYPLTVYIGGQKVTSITYVLEARAQVVSGEVEQVYLDLSNFKVEWTPMKNGQIINKYQETLTPTKKSLTISPDGKWHTIFSKSVDVSKYKPQSSTSEDWVIIINHCYPIKYSVDNVNWSTYQFENPLQIGLTIKGTSSGADIIVTLINELKNKEVS